MRDWIDVIFKVLIAAAAAYGTYYLASQKQDYEQSHTIQVQENEDIKLIVDMAAGDEVHRTMALAIAKNYAGKRVPRELFEAVNAFVTSRSTLAQATENNTVLGQVKASAQAAAAIQATANSLPIRVYIQYSRAEDRDAVEALRQKLNGQAEAGRTILAPPIEHVGIKIPSPVLKCFRKTECDTFGNALVARLQASNAPADLTLQRVEGYENSTAIQPYHFEAWLPSLSQQK